jgi:hypothetical protein
VWNVLTIYDSEASVVPGRTSWLVVEVWLCAVRVAHRFHVQYILRHFPTYFPAVSRSTSIRALSRLGRCEVAHECKLSLDTIIHWYSRFRSLCAKALDGLLIGGEGIVVAVPYQQTRIDIRRTQAKGSQRPFPLFPVFLAIFLPALSVQ